MKNSLLAVFGSAGVVLGLVFSQALSAKKLIPIAAYRPQIASSALIGVYLRPTVVPSFRLAACAICV